MGPLHSQIDSADSLTEQPNFQKCCLYLLCCLTQPSLLNLLHPACLHYSSQVTYDLLVIKSTFWSFCYLTWRQQLLLPSTL